MKKRVRIYKAGGQSDAVSQEDIYKYIADTMSAEDYDGDTDAISEKLAQVGIDSNTADAYIDEVDTYLKENNPEEEVVDYSELTPEEKAAAEAEQAALEEQNAAEEEARQAQLYAMYNTDTEEGVPDDNADEEIISRYGGAKPSKRSFINQYTKLAKKAEGGDTPSPGADDVLGGREQHVSNFFKGIGESVNSAQQKQAAEEQYHYAYGGIKMGAFEDGGIQQQQIDTESPLDHWSKQGATTRHIFSDNMYTQNDVAAMEQYGGFTDSDSGLYKFIGGGDNESADEQYQDSDLDYQRYAKRGGSLYKYQGTGNSIVDENKNGISDFVERPEEQKVVDTEDWKKKYEDLTSQNATASTAAAQNQQQMLQQYMLEQYMQQMGDQSGIGKFRSPIRRGMQYNQAVSSPYYTQSGENYTGPDLAGRTPTSVDVTKKGIFGKPKQYTVNYAGTPKISSFKAPIYTPGQGNTESGEPEVDINNPSINNKQSFGERVGRGMVNTKIPGIQQLGAKLIPWADVPNSPNKDWSDTINKFKEKYPKFNDFGSKKEMPSASNTFSKTSVNPTTAPIVPTITEKPLSNTQLIEKYNYQNDPESAAYQNKFPAYAGTNSADFWGQQQVAGRIKYSPEKESAMKKLGLNPDIYGHHYLYENQDKWQNPTKEYGGPVDYTQYAYGGDVSIPELYKAQKGFETGINECPIGSTKDYKGDCVDFAGNVTKKANKDFKLSEPEKLLENPFSQPKKNPLTGETPAVRMGSDGNYVNEGIKYGDQEDVSQKFKNKQAWDIDGKAIADDSLIAANAGAQQFKMANANKQQNQLQANLTSAESNFGVSNEDYSGNDDPNSGQFRPDQQGALLNSKYGGGIYATGGNTEDEDEDTQYMTQEEIDDFIANGGELEYL